MLLQPRVVVPQLRVGPRELSLGRHGSAPPPNCAAGTPTVFVHRGDLSLYMCRRRALSPGAPAAAAAALCPRGLSDALCGRTALRWHPQTATPLPRTLYEAEEEEKEEREEGDGDNLRRRRRPLSLFSTLSSVLCCADADLDWRSHARHCVAL